MNRRHFLRAFSAASVAAVAGIGRRVAAAQDARQIMTVRGPIGAGQMGFTLTHEHILASFQPYAEWLKAPLSYERGEVEQRMLPYLQRIASLGCKTFVDATAVGLGRDAVLLRRMSEVSGLNILTVTGNYAAFEHKFLPPYVTRDSEQALAQRWIDEWNHGIGGTGVKPGFIKLGFNGGPLDDAERKLIRASAIAHRATGLTIGAHTGPATAAFEQLTELERLGVQASAWIWIHAQNEKDPAKHEVAARRGAWISFDGVAPESLDAHVASIAFLRGKGLLNRVLASQDAGWYSVGKPRGGEPRGYDTVFTGLIPALRSRGFTQADIDTLFIDNPAAAFAIRVRATGV
jgi:phosphotriesterase-related protein